MNLILTLCKLAVDRKRNRRMGICETMEIVQLSRHMVRLCCTCRFFTREDVGVK